MARVTSAEVVEIIEWDSNIPLAPFIAVANLMVTKHLADESALTTDDLKEIEKWLAAHFYHIRDPKAVSERAGPVSESYGNKLDLHLNNTLYGQQAMMLDSTGTLANLNRQASRGKTVVSISWLGNDDDQGDVDQDT